MSTLLLFIIAVISYIIGSVNGAILISDLLYHKDIRRYGSGNAGLTNFFRTFGLFGTLIVLAVDVVKSLLAVVVGGLLLSIVGAKETGILFAGFCLMMGHVFPFYYHFKGGKGALCGGVVMFVVDWRVGMCCLVVFLLVVVFLRYVSLGSMTGAIASPIFLLAFGHSGLNTILGLICALLIIVEHAENIVRLIGGTEPQLTINSNQLRRRNREDDEEDFY